MFDVIDHIDPEPALFGGLGRDPIDGWFFAGGNQQPDFVQPGRVKRSAKVFDLSLVGERLQVCLQVRRAHLHARPGLAQRLDLSRSDLATAQHQDAAAAKIGKEGEQFGAHGSQAMDGSPDPRPGPDGREMISGAGPMRPGHEQDQALTGRLHRDRLASGHRRPIPGASPRSPMPLRSFPMCCRQSALLRAACLRPHSGRTR